MEKITFDPAPEKIKIIVFDGWGSDCAWKAIVEKAVASCQAKAMCIEDGRS